MCQRDGTCNGAGSCRLYTAGTECGAGRCQGDHRVRRQHLRRRGHLPGGRLAHLPRRRHLHGHLVRLQLHHRRQLPDRLLLRPGHLPGQAQPGAPPAPAPPSAPAASAPTASAAPPPAPRPATPATWPARRAPARRCPPARTRATSAPPTPPPAAPATAPATAPAPASSTPPGSSCGSSTCSSSHRDAGLHLQRPRHLHGLGHPRLRRLTPAAPRLLHQLQQRRPVQRRATAARAPAASRWAGWCCTGRSTTPAAPPRSTARAAAATARSPACGTSPDAGHRCVPPVRFPNPAQPHGSTRPAGTRSAWRPCRPR